MEIPVFLNIETLPAPGKSAYDFMDQVLVGNRGEEKAAEFRMKRGQELYLKSSTQPFMAQVFCFEVLALGDAEPEVIINAREDELIRALDEWVRLFLAESPGRRIVWHTFNGAGFDHPMLRLRALKYNCSNLLPEMFCPRYGDTRHVDWFLKLGVAQDGKGRIRGQLDEIAAFFGIHHPNPITGAQIFDCWRHNDHKAIREHGASRVLILRDLYTRLGSLDVPVVAQELELDEEMPA